jgi:hypothetical protein
MNSDDLHFDYPQSEPPSRERINLMYHKCSGDITYCPEVLWISKPVGSIEWWYSKSSTIIRFGYQHERGQCTYRQPSNVDSRTHRRPNGEEGNTVLIFGPFAPMSWSSRSSLDSPIIRLPSGREIRYTFWRRSSSCIWVMRHCIRGSTKWITIERCYSHNKRTLRSLLCLSSLASVTIWFTWVPLNNIYLSAFGPVLIRYIPSGNIDWGLDMTLRDDKI